VLDGTGSILTPSLEHITDTLALIACDLSLSKYEQELSQEWPKCLDRNPRAFLVTAAFWQLMQRGSAEIAADIILADVGANLGAINRATMVATDYVVVPLSPDLFSLQGLENLGPTLREWRENWTQRLERAPEQVKPLPRGGMLPIGYIVLQHSVRLDRPVSAYEKWIYRIPQKYHQVVKADDCIPQSIETDAESIAQLKHYRSLMPMAQEARKPIFHLKPADGAIGSHMAAVQNVRNDFEELARNIATRIGLQM
jgi:cellulose biosynthesis protein BcsQ